MAFDGRVSGQTLTFNVTGSAPFTMVDAQTGSERNGAGEATSGPLSGQPRAGRGCVRGIAATGRFFPGEPDELAPHIGV